MRVVIRQATAISLVAQWTKAFTVALFICTMIGCGSNGPVSTADLIIPNAYNLESPGGDFGFSLDASRLLIRDMESDIENTGKVSGNIQNRNVVYQ